jgi:hypothetical protein
MINLFGTWTLFIITNIIYHSDTLVMFLDIIHQLDKTNKQTLITAGLQIFLQNALHIPYILESNPHPFLQFQKAKKSDAY